MYLKQIATEIRELKAIGVSQAVINCCFVFAENTFELPKTKAALKAHLDQMYRIVGPALI